MRNLLVILSSSASIGLAVSGIVHADEISFQNGSYPDVNYFGTDDTYLVEAQPDASFSGVSSIRVDGNDNALELSALLRWDLSALSSNILVTAASIEINVTNNSSGNYQLYAMSSGWSEGATWSGNGMGGAWQTGGATGDFFPEPLAAFSDLSRGTQTIQLNDAGIAVIEGWASGRSLNHGFLLYDAETKDGLAFSSSDGASAESPRLNISYTDAPLETPANIRTNLKNNSGMWLIWDAASVAENVVGYRVIVNGVDKGVVVESDFRIGNLAADTQYTFLISALNSSEEESAPAVYRDSTYGADWTWPVWVRTNQPPVISGSPATTVRSGDEYTFTPIASDPDAKPYAIVFGITNKPSWATFNSLTGQISGVPGDRDIGTTSAVLVGVWDGKDITYLDAFDISVLPAKDVPPGQAADAAGIVRFFVDENSAFDVWSDNPNEAQKAFMRENYYRMQVYPPYFDQRLEWYPNAWAYESVYGMDPDDRVTKENPDWILKDANGNKLYIPYGCSGGSCSRYAADFGNDEFREWWLNYMEDEMSPGYIGMWLDNVNMKWRASNGNKQLVTPRDPRTGTTMTFANWQRYLAEFMEAIRARFPDAEIAHNGLWSALPADGNNQYLVRQALAADYINLERGVTDGDGFSGGTGKYGFETFLNYIDWVHGLGRSVILDDDDSDSVQERDLELAVYFLMNNGADLIGADGDRSRMNPDNFWAGYKTYLGEPLGKRYIKNDLFRRDFSCGLVIVNQPDEPTRTVQLGEPLRDLEGDYVTSVTLGDAEGAVLVRDCQ